MAKKKEKKNFKKPLRREYLDKDLACLFCKEKKIPDYKDYKELSKFLSDRAKILSVTRTGTCSKHQRRLAVEIKRARHLGLLPFASA